MPKKSIKKRTTRKKTTPKKARPKKAKVVKAPQTIIQAPSQKEPKIEKVMLENFVSLQRVMTNLSIKLDNLTTQISKLLDLFEISAKALAEKDFEIEKDNKDMLEKLDNLLDQNKILARGVTLVHERIPREKYYPTAQPIPPPQPMQPPQQPTLESSYMKEITPGIQGPPIPEIPQIKPPPKLKKPHSQEIPSPTPNLNPPSPSSQPTNIPSKPRFESPMEK